MIRFRLAAPKTDTHDNAIRRLRAAIKCLLRSYSLRCVELAEVKQDEDLQEPQG